MTLSVNAGIKPEQEMSSLKRFTCNENVTTTGETNQTADTNAVQGALNMLCACPRA